MKEAQLAPTTTARIVATTTGISTQNFGPRPPEVFAVDKPTKSPQNSFPCVIFNDLRCRPYVPSHCKYVIVPEKAGGGSTVDTDPCLGLTPIAEQHPTKTLEPSDTFCRLFTLAFATGSFPDGERKPCLIGIDCLMCRHAKFRPLASHGTP